eukprot:CAMPEP_0175156094 /NCGR_PEP_ID=MMETSP0087-20121206/21394_1 /TAXON_ID=136419 /ORGANISM="Unknown Unknown, Strain D1" /LENGTH=35 /DNA_ID= /DNA_START= /DNA_END= /DNA_ORIENTATION=
MGNTADHNRLRHADIGDGTGSAATQQAKAKTRPRV